MKDQSYKCSFYFTLRDTIVVRDIDAAYEIDSRAFRIVTENGEIIEQSGIISGGGKPRKGSMELTVA